MCLSKLIQEWSNLDEDAQVIIITDNIQKSIAEAIKKDAEYNVEIKYFSSSDEFLHKLKFLASRDLLIVLLSIDTFIKSGANNYFSPFCKPDWLLTKYAFIRLDISHESLFQGLSTEKGLVYKKINEMSRFTSNQFINVTNKSGTDITFKINPFSTCSHEIIENGGFAFLPPSETSSEVLSNTAIGKIVVDITIGQLYHFGELLGEFGIVQSPVTIVVENGVIVDIRGNDMALKLKEKLFSLPLECRELVELGQGLSQMLPTGLIGVDESIMDSCHFGFGDGGNCGTHLDVVISNPSINQL